MMIPNEGAHEPVVELEFLYMKFAESKFLLQFTGSNRFWNRTEQAEPVLTVRFRFQFSSPSGLSVQFSVLKKGIKNRTEPNFGNTNGDAPQLVLVNK